MTNSTDGCLPPIIFKLWSFKIDGLTKLFKIDTSAKEETTSKRERA